jgi:hypothetical protein
VRVFGRGWSVQIGGWITLVPYVFLRIRLQIGVQSRHGDVSRWFDAEDVNITGVHQFRSFDIFANLVVLFLYLLILRSDSVSHIIVILTYNFQGISLSLELTGLALINLLLSRDHWFSTQYLTYTLSP